MHYIFTQSYAEGLYDISRTSCLMSDTEKPLLAQNIVQSDTKLRRHSYKIEGCESNMPFHDNKHCMTDITRDQIERYY